MRNLVAFFIYNLILAFPFSIVAEDSVESVIGNWDKTYFVRNGQRNLDPRWTLGITFNKDATFKCVSHNTMEITLQNIETGELTGTVPRTMSHELRGRFKTTGSALTLEFGDTPLSVTKSCGFWHFSLENDSLLKTQFSLTESELTISSEDGKHELHFERKVG